MPVVSAFVPVQLSTDGNLPVQQIGLDVHSTFDGDPLAKPEPIGRRLHVAKMSALLPNGVSLTVECSDVDGLAAIIGALGHVQAER